jgi:hypothetical protein
MENCKECGGVFIEGDSRLKYGLEKRLKVINVYLEGGVIISLSYRIHPFKILRAKLYLFFTSISLFLVVLSYTAEPLYVRLFQCLAALFVFDHVPATPIFYKNIYSLLET